MVHLHLGLCESISLGENTNSVYFKAFPIYKEDIL